MGDYQHPTWYHPHRLSGKTSKIPTHTAHISPYSTPPSLPSPTQTPQHPQSAPSSPPAHSSPAVSNPICKLHRIKTCAAVSPVLSIIGLSSPSPNLFPLVNGPNACSTTPRSRQPRHNIPMPQPRLQLPLPRRKHPTPTRSPLRLQLPKYTPPAHRDAAPRSSTPRCCAPCPATCASTSAPPRRLPAGRTTVRSVNRHPVEIRESGRAQLRIDLGHRVVIRQRVRVDFGGEEDGGAGDARGCDGLGAGGRR